MMGSPEDEAGSRIQETTQHEVNLDPFYKANIQSVKLLASSCLFS